MMYPADEMAIATTMRRNKLLRSQVINYTVRTLYRCNHWCIKTELKVTTTKQQFEVSTTANCRFVVKSLIEISWKSNTKGVIIWEHFCISTSNNHL